MARVFLRLALTLLALAGGVDSWAQDPQANSANIVVNVTYRQSAGRILVNGVPVKAFATDPRARPDAPEQNLTEALALWLNNGDNLIVVESRQRAPGGYAEVRIMRGVSELLGKRIVGTGTADRSVSVAGLPTWGWSRSQPWTGDPRAVVASVRDLHAAFDRKNTAAFDAARQALERDLGPALGRMKPEDRKEMYDFTDRGGRRLALRPEGTAPVVRAFVQHRPALPWKAWYVAPNFRAEQPQAGRYRQHWQLGAEVLGVAEPELDVEVIALAHGFYRELGLGGVRLLVHSMGDAASQIGRAHV